jgi:hypothetical protein
MKLIFCVSLISAFTASLTVYGSSQVATTQGTIDSIVCTDFAPTADSDYFLTSQDSQAQVNFINGNVGVDYYDLLRPLADRQTGSLQLQNNSAGVISLSDGRTTLVLTPAGASGSYSALLTGDIEAATGWMTISNHPMKCAVTLSN